MARRKYHIRSEYRGKIIAFKDGLTLNSVNAMTDADRLIEKRPDIAKYFEDSEGRAISATEEPKSEPEAEPKETAKPKQPAKKSAKKPAKKQDDKSEEGEGFSASDLEE